jgi:hypothetical protein
MVAEGTHQLAWSPRAATDGGASKAGANNNCPDEPGQEDEPTLPPPGGMARTHALHARKALPRRAVPVFGTHTKHIHSQNSTWRPLLGPTSTVAPSLTSGGHAVEPGLGQRRGVSTVGAGNRVESTSLAYSSAARVDTVAAAKETASVAGFCAASNSFVAVAENGCTGSRARADSRPPATPGAGHPLLGEALVPR